MIKSKGQEMLRGACLGGTQGSRPPPKLYAPAWISLCKFCGLETACSGAHGDHSPSSPQQNSLISCVLFHG